MIARVVELAARGYVFVFLNVYGIGKIAGGQFYRPGRIPEAVADTRLGDANAFDLAWTFMGHSYAYILFIGLAEIGGAFLLLTERTKLLGVAVLLPIMVNILVFDVIFLDAYGALASASIYTALLLVILGCNGERVTNAFRVLVGDRARSEPSSPSRGRTLLLALAAMGALFVFDQALVNLLGHGSG